MSSTAIAMVSRDTLLPVLVLSVGVGGAVFTPDASAAIAATTICRAYCSSFFFSHSDFFPGCSFQQSAVVWACLQCPHFGLSLVVVGVVV